MSENEDSFERRKPSYNGSEKEILESFLDYHRATLLRKVSGLSDEDLKRPSMPPSTLTLLGLLKHLAFVEVWWFQCQFNGLPDPYPDAQDDPDFDFRINPGETAESIMAFYKEQVEISRQIVAGANLDDQAKAISPNGQPYTLRFVIAHMTQETARHNGHADLLREGIDGFTGA